MMYIKTYKIPKTTTPRDESPDPALRGRYTMYLSLICVLEPDLCVIGQ